MRFDVIFAAIEVRVVKLGWRTIRESEAELWGCSEGWEFVQAPCLRAPRAGEFAYLEISVALRIATDFLRLMFPSW
jgi:hypothetical protein